MIKIRKKRRSGRNSSINSHQSWTGPGSGLYQPGNLNHCDLVTPYGDKDLGQHWPRQWFVAWRHQAITWTNVDLSSVRSSGIHLRAILQDMSQPSVTEISLKITNLKFCWNNSGAIELISSLPALVQIRVAYCPFSRLPLVRQPNLLLRPNPDLTDIVFFSLDSAA